MRKCLFILLIVTGSVFSQNTSDLKKSALRDAKAVASASIRGNYNMLLKHTHPKIYKKYGGAELREAFVDIYKTWKAQKIKIVSSQINEITEVKKEQKEYRCLVKNTIRMDFNGRKATLKSSLFGFYDKKKKYWYFIESDKLLNDEETKNILKGFKTEIQIPEDEHVPDS